MKASRSVTLRTAPWCVGVQTPAEHTMFLVGAAEIVTAACAPTEASTAVAASSSACGFCDAQDQWRRVFWQTKSGRPPLIEGLSTPC